MGFPSRTVRMCPTQAIQMKFMLVSRSAASSAVSTPVRLGDIGGNADLAQQEHLKGQIGSDTKTEGMMDTRNDHRRIRPGTLIHATRMGCSAGRQGRDMDGDGIGKHSRLPTHATSSLRPRSGTIYAALSVAVSDAGSLYKSTVSRATSIVMSRRRTMMHIGQVREPDVSSGARRSQSSAPEAKLAGPMNSSGVQASRRRLR